MVRLATALVAIAASVGAACGKRGGAKRHDDPPAPVTPVTCPPGSVASTASTPDCVTVATADAAATVAAQAARLRDLARTVGTLDALTASVDAVEAMSHQPAWAKLETVSGTCHWFVVNLTGTASRMRTLSGALDLAADRLDDVKRALDRLVTDTTGRTLADVQAQISRGVRDALEPAAVELAAALDQVLVPVAPGLDPATAVIVAACRFASVAKPTAEQTRLCAAATDLLPKAVAYVEDARTRPAAVLVDVTAQVTAALDPVIDADTRAALASAQADIADSLGSMP